MKRILILTCSTGEGHNSAAKAIETALRAKDVSCVIRDPISFKSERMQHLVSDLYNVTIRKKPRVFGAVYRLGHLYSEAGLPSPVYWANARYSRALEEYIRQEQFDAVICTHLYGMEAMTAICRHGRLNIPCFGVMTDYVCIPFLSETRLTRFFVPSEETREFLMEKGIEGDTILITGIPVDGKFCRHPDREQARRTLGMPPRSRVYLVMTGGVGCENMETLCKKLLARLAPGDLMVVLTGKNQQLREHLNEACGDHPGFRAVEFTREVATYMAAADVLLSKPGGLSSTEAAVANVPLVHIHAIPGCETYNQEFFAAHGMALPAESDEEAVEKAMLLAENPDQAAKMRQMQRRYVRPDAAEQIAQEVLIQCSSTK